MDKYCEAHNQLVSVYEKWWEQLKALDKNACDLSGLVYTLPYFSFIPKRWFQPSVVKVLVVGEEARGDWDKDGWRNADISRIMQWSKEHQTEQLTQKTNSAFWKRVKRIENIAGKDIVCAWTNLDKIHRNGKENCALTGIERTKLHSTDIKILREEIRILQPDAVVFCGYHKRRTAIEIELPSVAEKFYGEEGVGYTKPFDEKIYQVLDEGISYIFAQHPNRKSNAYEEKVILALKRAIEN